MSKMSNAANSAKDVLQDLHRFLKGGQPIPEAADKLGDFLSNREDLPSENWVSSAGCDPNVSSEIVVFAYEFFVSMGIPFGKVRPGDRLKDDLHLGEVLQDDWDYDLHQVFKERFGKRLKTKRQMPVATMADLLLHLQQALSEGRSPSP